MASKEKDLGEEEAKLTLTVKTTRRKETVKIAGEATVRQLKEEVAKAMGPEAPVESQCLIFAGKILKDDQSVESQAVKDGVTIHLVVRSNKPPSTGSGPPSSQSASVRSNGSSTTSTPAPPTSSGGSSGPGGTGLPPGVPLISPYGMGGGAGGGDFQAQMAQMQQQLMSNPDLLRQMMESPMMQNLMSNPEALQSLLTSNPQIQQLMERNPELNHILHNPELMRQAMEMARNPAAMREHMRSQDRQLSNIESLPGGFNALARMYTEIQEPMMDAAQESLQQQLQNNPFAALLGQQQTPPDPGPAAPQGTTNTAPLPNPWAAPGSSTPRTTGTSSSTTTSSTSQSQRGGAGQRQQPGTQRPQTTGSQPGVGGNFPPIPPGNISAMMQQLQRNPELMRQMMAMQGGGAAGGGAGGMANLFAQDPEMLATMMQNPMVQQSMQHMMNNPQLLEQMIRNNPMLAGNPQAEEVARNAAQMMQTEEMRQMMSNPEALRAMMQVQQGMQQLQQSAPGLFGGLGAMGGMGGVAPPTAGAATTTTTTNTGSQPSTGVGGTGGGASDAQQQQLTAQALQQALSQVLSQQQGGATTRTTPSTTTAPPSSGGVGPGGVANPATVENQFQQAEVLYQSQLEQLQMMGFSNRQANLRALVESGGDLNAAVNRLLQ